MKKGLEFQTGDNLFISFLQEKFGDQLGFDNSDDTREFIAKSKSFYNAVKDAHRGQKRKTGEKYFDDHVLSVAEITLNFSNATIRDVLIALGHDYVEDHRELTYSQALNHILTTFGPKRGPVIKTGVERLTKYDLQEYLPNDIKEAMNELNPAQQQDFLQQNKKEFGLIRGDKYFLELKEYGTDGEVRVKVADSVHNLMSCHSLGKEKIIKTLFEKEQYLLPIIKDRGMEEEIALLTFAILETKKALLLQTSAQNMIDVFKAIGGNDTSDRVYRLFRNAA